MSIRNRKRLCACPKKFVKKSERTAPWAPPTKFLKNIYNFRLCSVDVFPSSSIERMPSNSYVKHTFFVFHFQRILSIPGVNPYLFLKAWDIADANSLFALTKLSMCNLEIKLNVYKTIGYSFLKYAVTDYLYHIHPQDEVGKLSIMRSEQVVYKL